MHDYGINANKENLKTLEENNKTAFPGWTPKLLPEEYSRMLYQAKYRLKEKLEAEMKNPDVVCPVVPDVFSDLPHLLHSDATDMMESRWPLFQNRKCLIG